MSHWDLVSVEVCHTGEISSKTNIKQRKAVNPHTKNKEMSQDV